MEKGKLLIEQNGVVYYLEGAKESVVEKYDDKLNAEYGELEYNFIKGYEGDIRELDLSWISTQDVIDLKANPGLGKVKINCSNVKKTKLNSEKRLICDINVDTNIVAAGSALKRFIMKNMDVIDVINFNNVSNPLVKTYLEDLCKKYNIICHVNEIDVISEEVQVNA